MLGAYSVPTVPREIAEGFVDALRSEYLDGRRGGVEDFYSAKRIPGVTQASLDPLEEVVRNAADKRAAIETLATQFQLLRPGPGMPAGPAAPRLGSGRSPNSSGAPVGARRLVASKEPAGPVTALPYDRATSPSTPYFSHSSDLVPPLAPPFGGDRQTWGGDHQTWGGDRQTWGGDRQTWAADAPAGHWGGDRQTWGGDAPAGHWGDRERQTSTASEHIFVPSSAASWTGTPKGKPAPSTDDVKAALAGAQQVLDRTSPGYGLPGSTTAGSRRGSMGSESAATWGRGDAASWPDRPTSFTERPLGTGHLQPPPLAAAVPAAASKPEPVASLLPSVDASPWKVKSAVPSKSTWPTINVRLNATTEERFAALRKALSLPDALTERAVVLSALKSEDLEIVRVAVVVAPTAGLELDGPNVKESVSRLRWERQLPWDWDIAVYAKGRRLPGGCGGRTESTVVAFHLQPEEMVSEVQALFDQTYRKVHTRDRRGAPIPDKFVVREVHRVMNDQVWREYCQHRGDVKDRLKATGYSQAGVPGGVHTMDVIEKLSSMGPPARAGRAGFPKLDERVCETWLFHGTTKEAALGIAENDFRLDLTGSNAGTLYGNGIYLAENVTKADEYGEGPRGPAGEHPDRGHEGPPPSRGPLPPLVRESYILICRATLGKVLYTDESRPNRIELQQECLQGHYDCVVGDRLKRHGTFREFVLYNDDNVYPEFVVRYERQFFHERFREIYAAMSRRWRDEKSFTGPTEEERQVLVSMWNVYGMPNKGKINRWQLLDLLKSIDQPPENEEEDLDATFREWDTNNDGWIDREEFLQEIVQRIKDGREYYG